MVGVVEKESFGSCLSEVSAVALTVDPLNEERYLCVSAALAVGRIGRTLNACMNRFQSLKSLSKRWPQLSFCNAIIQVTPAVLTSSAPIQESLEIVAVASRPSGN